MSHTEKDCSIVADNDKELVYGWGMDLRASPRKGLSKNKEEIDALKLNKNLFVLKPMSSPKDSVNRSTTMSSAARFFLDGDIGCSTFLSEESDGDSKRSCVASGVSLKQIDDSISSVAGVGVVQPHE